MIPKSGIRFSEKIMPPQKAMPIRAILFDKDGTLVDFQRTWGPATQTVLAHYAGGDQTVFEELAAVSGFVPAEQRFRVDSPLIGGAAPPLGPLWAETLPPPPPPEVFAPSDRL